MIEEHGETELLELLEAKSTIEYLRNSQFDWFFSPDYFPLIVEGRYDRDWKKSRGKEKQTGFSNFEERRYDMDALERMLIE